MVGKGRSSVYFVNIVKRKSGVLIGQVFDLSSFLSFTAWYETKYNIKLDADPAELTKLITAFKTIQNALSIDVNVQYVEGRRVDVPKNYLDISLYEEDYGKLDAINLNDGIKKTEEFMRGVYHVRY